MDSYSPAYFLPEGEDWDGRPQLTEEGLKMVEKEFKARYDGSSGP